MYFVWSDKGLVLVLYVALSHALMLTIESKQKKENVKLRSIGGA